MVKFDPSPISTYSRTRAFEEGYESNREENDRVLKTCEELKDFLSHTLEFLNKPGNNRYAEQILHFLTGKTHVLPAGLKYPDQKFSPEVQATLRDVLQINSPSGFCGWVGIGWNDYSEKIRVNLKSLHKRLNNWGFAEVDGVQGKVIASEVSKGVPSHFAWVAKSAKGWSDAELDVPAYSKTSLRHWAKYNFEKICKYREQEQRYDEKNLGIYMRELKKYPMLHKLWEMQRGVSLSDRAKYMLVKFPTNEEFWNLGFLECDYSAGPPENQRALEHRIISMAALALNYPALAKKYEARAKQLVEEKYPNLDKESVLSKYNNEQVDNAEETLTKIEFEMKQEFMAMCLSLRRKKLGSSAINNFAKEIAKY